MIPIVSAAFGLGFALGAAPGPVQLLILAESSRDGFTRGLRVMLGANSVLFLVVLGLAFGVSSLEPAEAGLRALRIAGGGFLTYVGLVELRSARREREPDADASPTLRRRLGPTARGVVAVALNPAAWIFFATTASAVMAEAVTARGRDAAVIAAVAMTCGVSCSDLLFSALGSGGHRVLGERGLRLVRIGLAGLLVLIGSWFVVLGLAGGG